MAGLELVQMPVRQVAEADVETFVRGLVARADGAHVRLHGHQQRRIETDDIRLEAGLIVANMGG